RSNIYGENFIPKMLDELKVSGSIEERKRFIDEFNTANRWKKRGLSIVPMRYPLDYLGSTKYPAYVCIYNRDGTVAVSTGGIEVGQGLNTKVAQAVAFELGVPIEKVKVKPSNNLVSPNTDSTGGSVSSELCVFGALMCCKTLNERMKPIKDKSKGAKWEKIVKLCNKAGIHLAATYMPGPQDKLNSYDIWVVNATEVEIDCLTGESKVIHETLCSFGFILLAFPKKFWEKSEPRNRCGAGLWTTEKLVYSNDPPGLLTYNTWQYKPPLPKDIPEDLRVTLLKDAPNPLGILRSKATGEPPLCSSVCVLFALKNAIFAARKEAGNAEWFRLVQDSSEEQSRITATKGIPIGHLNVRDILAASKKDDIASLIQNVPFHIFGISETWLYEKVTDEEVSIPGYHLIRSDRQSVKTLKNRGGGVALYIRNDYTTTIVTKKVPPPIDLLHVSITKALLPTITSLYYTNSQNCNKKSC
ncbi:Xanthine dehydrogenase/oxidase, partial [Orchesella cincta]